MPGSAFRLASNTWHSRMTDVCAFRSSGPLRPARRRLAHHDHLDTCPQALAEMNLSA
jgi:hypothetical protein